MSDRLATVRTAMAAECVVAALCLDCNRPADLDLAALAKRGYADTFNSASAGLRECSGESCQSCYGVADCQTPSSI